MSNSDTYEYVMLVLRHLRHLGLIAQNKILATEQTYLETSNYNWEFYYFAKTKLFDVVHSHIHIQSSWENHFLCFV